MAGHGIKLTQVDGTVGIFSNDSSNQINEYGMSILFLNKEIIIYELMRRYPPVQSVFWKYLFFFPHCYLYVALHSNII